MSVLTWLALPEGSHLELEQGEDVAQVFGDWLRGELTQVKDLAENLTLRKAYAVKFLADSAFHVERNADVDLSFLYLTTASVGNEQGITFPEGRSGVAAWEQVREADSIKDVELETLETLRSLLLTRPQPDKCKAEAWQAFRRVLEKPQQAGLLPLVRRVRWSVDSPDLASVGAEIRAELILQGLAKGENDAAALHGRLLLHVCELLGRAGEKRLGKGKLLAVVEAALTQRQLALLERLEEACPEFKVLFSEIKTELRATRKATEEIRELTLTNGEIASSTAKALEALPQTLADRGYLANQELADQLIEGVLSSLSASRQELPDPPSSGAFTARIDSACEHLKGVDRHPRVARALLETLREDERWPKLSDTERFRVLANLGHTYLSENKSAEAARYYDRACSAKPDHEQVPFLEAFQLLIVGEEEEAYRVCERLRIKHEDDYRLFIVWVRTSPTEIPFADLEAACHEEFLAHVDVCVALAERAQQAGDLAVAETYARAGVTADQNWAPALRALAVAVLQQETNKVEEPMGVTTPFGDPERLEEVIDCLSRAIELPRLPADDRYLGHLFVDRAVCNYCLGRLARMQRDLASAEHYAFDCGDPELMGRWAQWALANHGFDALADRLGDLDPSELTPLLRLLLAVALANRNEGGDCAEARRLLEGALPEVRDEPRLFEDYLRNWVEIVAEAEGWDGVLTRIQEGWSSLSLSTVCSSALRARAEHALGEVDTARRYALEALEALSDESPEGDRRRLAQVLASVGLYEKSVGVWSSFVDTMKVGPDLRGMIRSAALTDRVDLIQTIGQGLRERGTWDPFILMAELDVLERYDMPMALEVIRLGVERFPENKLLRLRQSAIGLHLQQVDLQVSDPSELPSVESVSAELGQRVVMNLRQAGNPNEAARYAYDLVQRFPNSDHALDSLTWAFFPMGGPSADFDEPSMAGLDAAVELRFPDRDETEWFILETDERANAFANDFGESSALFKALEGGKVGDHVVLPADREGAKAEIVSVRHKWVGRFNQVLRRSQILRDTPAPFIRLEAKGKTREEILMALEESAQRLSDRDPPNDSAGPAASVLAEELSIPVSRFAAHRDECTFLAMQYIAQRPAARLRCCQGSSAERKRALADLASDPRVVLGPTAVATLYMLSAFESIAESELELHLPQAVLNTLLSLQRLIRLRAEVGEQQSELVAQLVKTLKASAEVKSGLPLAQLPPSERAELVQSFDQETAESVALAVTTGAVLWTDDLQVATQAQARGARTAWTQAVLLHLLNVSNIAKSTFQDLSARLVGFGHESTTISCETCLRISELAEWDPRRAPLRQAMIMFRHSSIRAQALAGFLAGYLPAVWLDAPGPFAPVITLACLECFRGKPSWDSAVAWLSENAEPAFGINLVHATQFQQIVELWLERARGQHLWLPPGSRGTDRRQAGISRNLPQFRLL